MNEPAPSPGRYAGLERELGRQLAPVAAPEALWDRIQEPRRSVVRGLPVAWIAWPAAAVVVSIVCAGVFWKVNHPREPLAELPPASKNFDFRSSDFGAIRKWVKTESNIDIDMPDGSSAAAAAPVLLLGVRLIRFRGRPSAAIDYRVGEGTATLVVSGKGAGLNANAEMGKHLFSATRAAGNERLISWSMRNQNYTIAFSGAKDLRGGCLLCHANSRGMITVN